MKKMIYLICFMICLSGIILVQAKVSLADDTPDENTLFSGGDTVVNQDQVVNKNTGDELKDKHIGFSGQISTDSTFTKFAPWDDWTGQGGQDQNLLMNQMAADFFVDIRLTKGIKGFLSFGVNYSPALSDAQKSQMGPNPPSTITNYQINEFFVDTNWKNKVYFRTGKQVLKWGTGYFWNPTDLVNIDKKTFLNMNKVVEGTFGEKIQIPFGVKQNIYFFAGMNDATTTNGVSLAGKYEFLVGNTEMSFSAWAKENYKPIFGYDFSGRIGDVDVRGEASLYPSDDQRKIMNYDTLAKTWITQNEPNDWNPRACLGFTKYFDNGNIKDRISVTGEFYYNAAGYDQNIFQKIATETDSNVNQDPKSIFINLIAPNESLYQPFMNSKYYMALFSSVQKFMDPDVTLNINDIANLVDHSSTLTTGISYTPALTDLTINLNVNFFLGDRYTEATFAGNRYSVDLGVKILF